MPILDRERRSEPTRRRLTELETEVEELAERVDALLDALSRMARQHHGSPLLQENSVTRALHQARRR